MAGDSWLELSGVYTHFACADDAAAEPTLAQIALFRSVLDEVRAAGVDPGLVHADNSAALELGAAVRDALPEAGAVRPGLMLYGARSHEAEVEGLADRFALIDTALLAANKRIVNLGMELMGAGTLQRLAAENDARGHTAQAARQMFKDLGEKGVKQAIADRDAPFGDGRVRVDGPELRDADGRLLPEEESGS